MNLPNKLTVIRIAMIPVFMIFAEWGASRGTYAVFGSTLNIPLVIAMLIFALASFTDWLDGYIARRDNIVTNFGKFADPLADKMLVATALIELVTIGLAPAWVVALIIMRELAVTGLRLLLVQSGEVMAAKWPGKVKTFTQMLAIIFLLIGDFPFGFLPFSLGTLLLYLALFFTLYSGYDYFAKNTHVFKDGL
ncbi:CDP-diacylglycerol--glycerol-3-phosphate 3-phosphatidyltransferase [Aerococcus kribbianus]|uniref:CDP-diacylglycerol--glycerol-3-phosphate 3-phosphatidyltransferase n=1 Tax=Aerococcus kribbianus TaxID=2999064 RepID=A0A9X3JEZ5_9LACT|nr:MULTISPECIES: CDP-diacylglycerol--glycerol-3-phosphate 3-phosphatidyltransferase [unclassified Aerococcus]MCZ0717679.1 CDP-diacylglycerol--glycerol-3-phosphate 3-phosphatidyltransferase [Aerococcus sp. YH-aer221]MCZ0725967.1 CDP-diacylglycerol--glycerol-3-phosphate 3-phosphatidyltransferase [Aerococcus sp. YH-aer222]